MKILVCDDDDMLASMVRFKLTREKLGEVVRAYDGRQGMALLQSESFDLIISDIHMPFHSGLEIISFVRDKQGKKIPIIVLSAEGLEETILHAFTLGANDFLTKPFSPAELVIRVKRLLPSS